MQSRDDLSSCSSREAVRVFAVQLRDVMGLQQSGRGRVSSVLLRHNSVVLVDVPSLPFARNPFYS